MPNPPELPKVCLERLLRWLVLCCLTLLPQWGAASDPTPESVPWQALQDHPSSSTLPIEFSIDGVRYKVPRNYLIRMDNWSGGPQTLVAFRVTHPGLTPRRIDTQRCLIHSGHPCARLDFFLSKGDPTSDEQSFENAKQLFKSPTPEHDAYGFEEYNTGPPEARIVTFRDPDLFGSFGLPARYGTSGPGPGST